MVFDDAALQFHIRKLPCSWRTNNSPNGTLKFIHDLREIKPTVCDMTPPTNVSQ